MGWGEGGHIKCTLMAARNLTGLLLNGIRGLAVLAVVIWYRYPATNGNGPLKKSGSSLAICPSGDTSNPIVTGATACGPAQEQSHSRCFADLFCGCGARKIAAAAGMRGGTECVIMRLQVVTRKPLS